MMMATLERGAFNYMLIRICNIDHRGFNTLYKYLLFIRNSFVARHWNRKYWTQQVNLRHKAYFWVISEQIYWMKVKATVVIVFYRGLRRHFGVFSNKSTVYLCGTQIHTFTLNESSVQCDLFINPQSWHHSFPYLHWAGVWSSRRSAYERDCNCLFFSVPGATGWQPETHGIQTHNKSHHRSSDGVAGPVGVCNRKATDQYGQVADKYGVCRKVGGDWGQLQEVFYPRVLTAGRQQCSWVCVQPWFLLLLSFVQRHETCLWCLHIVLAILLLIWFYCSCSCHHSQSWRNFHFSIDNLSY